MVKKGKYSQIIDIGTYFSSNNEYDCVFKKEDNTYAVYEVKYKTKALSKKGMLKELEQIYSIKGITISEIGFISSSGFEEKLPRLSYLELTDIFTL